LDLSGLNDGRSPPVGGRATSWRTFKRLIMYYVYAIYNDLRDKIYIGQTADLEKRLQRHNKVLKSKASSFTSKNSGTWRLIYQECYNTREEATKREKELKSFQGRQFVKKFIK